MSIATEATLFARLTNRIGLPSSSGYGYLFWPLLLALTFVLGRFSEGAGILAVAAFLFVPGYALVRALNVELDSLETAFISVLAGVAILLTITNVIAMSPIGLSGEAILVGEIFVLLLLLPFSLKRRNTIQPSIRLTDWLLILAVAFAPLLLLRAVSQHDFFMGYDPFAAAYFSDSIATHSISPLSFRSHDVNFSGHNASGFYYFTAGMSLVSGVTAADITRYGGLALLGLSVVAIFLVVRASFQRPFAGFMAGALLMSNPFVLDRFIMYIRENLAIVLYLGLLLLLIKAARPIPTKTLLLATLLTGVIIQVQPFVGLLSIMAWFALLLWLRFQPDSHGEWQRVAFLATAGTALLALPSGAFVVWQYAAGYIPAQVRSVAGALPADHEVLSIWDRGIFWDDFGLYALALAPLGLLFLVLQRASHTRATLLLASSIAPVLAILLLAWLGASMPVVRTILYLAIWASILGGLGVALLVSASSGLILRIGFLAGAAYVVLVSAQTLYDFEKWSPFEGDQVAAAVVAAERSESENAIVLTPFNELGLMGFAGVPGVVTDRDDLLRVLTASSLEELASDLNSLGAEDSQVLFFISKRFAGDSVQLVASALGGSSRPFTLLTLLRQNSPDEVSLGALSPLLLPDSNYFSGPLFHVAQIDLGAAFLYEIETINRDEPE